MFSFALATFVLGFDIDEFRRRGASSTTEVHHPAECFIGAGYSIFERDCLDAPPVIQSEKCNETHSSTDNCIEEEMATGSEWHNYNMKTESSSDFDKLMSTVVGAEGAGWGLSISASAGYMKSHSTTSNTIAFWVGTSGDTFSEVYRNPKRLQLNPAAKTMLQASWETFVATYGTHYVHRVIHSTRFMGSAQISSRSEKDASSLSVAAKISYSSFFTVGASTEFNKATKGENNELKTTVTSFYQGKLVEYEDNDNSTAVEKLHKQYISWMHNVAEDKDGNSAPTRLVYRSWADLIEIQEIITTTYPESEWGTIFSALAADLPTKTTLDILSEEYIWTGTKLNTLKMYLEYDCVKNNHTLAHLVDSKAKTLSSHMVTMENMRGSEIMLRESEIESDDWSWFMGLDLDYNREILAQLELCPLDTCSCDAPQSEGRDANNGITCSASGKHNCNEDEMCWDTRTRVDRPWRELCRKDLCHCEYPNTGNNQITCSSEITYCPTGVKCISDMEVFWGDWEPLCGATQCGCLKPFESAEVVCTVGSYTCPDVTDEWEVTTPGLCQRNWAETVFYDWQELCSPRPADDDRRIEARLVSVLPNGDRY